MTTTCPKCGQSIPNPPCDLPVARRVRGLLYLGRQVFLIDGDSSLWATGGRSLNKPGNPKLCFAPERNGRGHSVSSRKVTLYRIDDVTSQVRVAWGLEGDT